MGTTSMTHQETYRKRQLLNNPLRYKQRQLANSRKYRERKLSENLEEFRRKNREASARWRINNLESVRSRQKNYPKEKQILTNAKYRAKKYGVPFNLELADISIPERCPVLGIPIENGTGSHKAGSPTIDRLIPEQGYVKGNVAIISFRANTLKNDASFGEIEMLCNWLKKATKQ